MIPWGRRLTRERNFDANPSSGEDTESQHQLPAQTRLVASASDWARSNPLDLNLQVDSAKELAVEKTVLLKFSSQCLMKIAEQRNHTSQMLKGRLIYSLQQIKTTKLTQYKTLNSPPSESFSTFAISLLFKEQ
ncbi:hypothetical protein V2J09_024272 [Rumex salicifolius]